MSPQRKWESFKEKRLLEKMGKDLFKVHSVSQETYLKMDYVKKNALSNLTYKYHEQAGYRKQDVVDAYWYLMGGDGFYKDVFDYRKDYDAAYDDFVAKHLPDMVDLDAEFLGKIRESLSKLFFKDGSDFYYRKRLFILLKLVEKFYDKGGVYALE